MTILRVMVVAAIIAVDPSGESFRERAAAAIE
jgi:hypothetical protein